MEVIEHIETEIKFSPEEESAIKTIVDIDCRGILCRSCPLGRGYDGELCIKGAIREVFNNYIMVRND